MSRYSMRCLPCLTLFLLLATPAFAQLAPWWISDDGCQLFIIQEHGEQVTIVSQAPLRLRQTAVGAIGYSEQTYVLDADGDLCKSSWEHYDPSIDLSPYGGSLSPPCKVLDYPLTPGKTWVSESLVRSSYGGIARPYVLTGTVVGPRVVETGIGQLEVVEVTHEFFIGTDNHRTYTYLLHETLGDVTQLASIAECDLVPVKETSWGCLKSMYR